MIEAQNINVGRDLAGRDINTITDYSEQDLEKLFKLLNEAYAKRDKNKLSEFLEKVTSKAVSEMLADFIFKLF